jgi:low temperature requirement protein LtrA
MLNTIVDWQRNFVESMAGYSILCYILQVFLFNPLALCELRINVAFFIVIVFRFHQLLEAE